MSQFEQESAVERVGGVPPSGDKGIEFRQWAELRLVSGQEVFSERKTNGSGEFCGWVPTVELTVQVRAHPATNPIAQSPYDRGGAGGGR